jgi:hypothetical protein
VIKGTLIKLNDLRSPPLVLLVAEVAVDVSSDSPVKALSSPNPYIDLSMAVSTLRGLSYIDIIAVTLATLIGGIEVCVDRRQRIRCPRHVHKLWSDKTHDDHELGQELSEGRFNVCLCAVSCALIGVSHLASPLCVRVIEGDDKA